MTTVCGAFGLKRSPTDDSKKVVTDTYDEITKLHEHLADLKLNELLDNHTYTTQVVAGRNYKFFFANNGHNFEVVVWAKLDGTYSVTLKNVHVQTS